MSAFDPYSEQEAVPEMRERMHRRAQDEAERNRAALAECESLSGGCGLPSTPPCEPPSALQGAPLANLLVGKPATAGVETFVSPSLHGFCAGCGASFTAAGGLPGNLCVRCNKLVEKSAMQDFGVQPGVNDDLAAFRELTSGMYQTFCPHCGAQVDEVSETWSRAVCETCLREFTPPHVKRPDMPPPPPDALSRALAEIESAHAACDSSWRRIASSDGRTYTLAERIGGMRQMIDDYERWLDEEKVRNVWQHPAVNDNLMRIVLFFLGAIAGIFLAWGFLAFAK